MAITFRQLMEVARPGLWSTQLWFYLLFAMHSHLLAEITDIEPDRAAGRRTTAVVLGVANTKLLVAAMLFVESLVVSRFVGVGFTSGWAVYGKQMVVGFLSLAGAGFVVDCLFRGDATISDRHLRWVLIVWNGVAVASMYFVWRASFFVT